MAWKIDLTLDAQKDLSRLDRQDARLILRFLNERILQLDNPRAIGEALRGPDLGRYWKYRVGDYRLICSIQDQLVRIMVIRIGNRREIYR